MKVLVIGSGGREHTLVWKISQSPKANEIFCAPGNAGIAKLAQCIDIKAESIEGLLDFAGREKIDLTVVGPEAPLVSGIVDCFEEKGLRIFGPRKEAALLEGSKVFSKQIMAKYGIPTGECQFFDNPDTAKAYIEKIGAPVVVKADGLAQGKGVFVSQTIDEARTAVKLIMQDRIFGDAGNRVLIEECLNGEEASFIVFTDGERIAPMVTSQDHKRIFDGDKGENTGGMGAYSPAPVITEGLFKQVMQDIIQPTIQGMAKEGKTYKGVLYAGIMVTRQGPKVLEFNVRFGDPETQVILPRLEGDLLEVMESVIDGRLPAQLDWDKRACVCVVLASGGYPGKYEKGKQIRGLDEVKSIDDTIVFHAGTREESGKCLTNGGRVLGVTSLGEGIRQAIDKAYQAVEKIDFAGMHYRKDIGYRAIKHTNPKSETLNPKQIQNPKSKYSK